MSTHNYSADNIALDWIIGDMTDGLAQGTFVSETEGEGGWTNKSNAKGTRVVRTFNPEKMGTTDITVDQESQVYQQLIGVYNLDSKPATRTQVGQMTLRDFSSGEEIRWVNAYIAKKPNITRGTEGATAVFTFNYERKEQEAVETLESPVGV